MNSIYLNNALTAPLSMSYSPLKKRSHVSVKMPQLISCAFQALKATIYFPTRYLGAKTWSLPGTVFRTFQSIIKKSKPVESYGKGYEWKVQPISSDKTKSYLRYFCMMSFAFNKKESWISPFKLKPIDCTSFNFSKLPGHINATTSCFFDAHTGLKALLAERDNEVIIAFASTGGSYTEIKNKRKANLLGIKQRWTHLAVMLGAKPKVYQHAAQFIGMIKDHPSLKDKKFVLAGHCLGGTLASYAALKNRVHAISINTMPFGAGLQQDLGEKALNNAKDYVTHVSVKGDYVSHVPWVNFIDKPLAFLGIRTPGNFGNRYLIPSAYRYFGHTHDFMIGSVMKHIGYDKRTKPAGIDPKDFV